MITAKDIERVELIKYLVKKYTKDMELGFYIRKLFNDQDEETKEELEKNIIENQQKLAGINFIGKTENIIFDLLGKAQLSRIDGSVYTLRYDSENCRLFLFINQETNNKRVEYFELRNNKTELLNSKQALEGCYKEFGLLN